jgi:hypothetical protein
MSQALGGSEFTAANSVVLLSNEIYAYLEGVEYVGLIITNSQCTVDLQLHQTIASGAAHSLVSVADKRLPIINELLTLLKTRAAIDEATKLRDLIVETRSVYRPLAREN